MKQKKNRKERRNELQGLKFLHTSKQQTKVVEKVLDDGSIQFDVEGFVSTEVKDGSGDIVMAEGIKLDRYLENPVIKVGHKRGVESNIGQALTIGVKEIEGIKGLYITAKIILSPEIEDHKKIIHGLRHNLINGFSMGFGNIVQTFDVEKNANIIESMELYENSLVDIPDNPLTVRKMLDMIIKDKKEKGVEEIKEETPIEEKEEVKEEIEEVEGDEELETKEDDVETKEEIEEVVSEKALDMGDSLESELAELVATRLGIVEGEGNKRVYVVALYKSEFVFNYYSFGEGDDSFDKYFRIGYTTSGEAIALIGDPVEVETQRIWVDKALAMRGDLGVKDLEKDGDAEAESKEEEVIETVEPIVEEEKKDEVTEDKKDSQETEELGNESADVETPENGDDEGVEGTDKKALEIKDVELEKVKSIAKQYEESLTKMVDANKALIKSLEVETAKNATLESKITKFKKMRIPNGLTYEGEKEKAHQKGLVGGIVKMMRK